MHILLTSFILALSLLGSPKPESATIKLALVKYNGGGDWYANPTSLTNLAVFCNQELNTSFDPDYATVEVGSADLFNHPFLHMTGHGNVVFSDSEADNLRTYLIAGGFLHIDDNYGMNEYVIREIKKVFPDYELTELPYSHEIYHQKYNFQQAMSLPSSKSRSVFKK